MKLDLSKFNRALMAKASSVKSEAAKELNKALRMLGKRVAEAIPPVPKSEIKADLLSDPHLLAAMTSKRLKKKGIGILPPPMFRKAMDSFLRFKMGSSGYMRSPWAQIARSNAKGFVGIVVTIVLATAKKLRCQASFTMKQQNNTHYASAKARFVKEVQPVLDSIVKDIDAREVLKGWKG